MSHARFLHFALLVAPAVSAQATLHVPADVATIQGAIELAQDGDIVLVAPGTYFEELDFLGRAITVASEAGAAATTIDANGNTVVSFLLDEGDGSVLRGFTLTGARTGLAGGVRCSPDARPRIERCTIRGNRVSAGGAAGILGSPTVEDCLIEQNENAGGPGGIWGAPVLRRCVLRGNRGYDGAAMYLFGGRVEDCDIVENAADEGSSGGAVAILGPGVVLERCLIARNVKSTFSGFYSARGAGVYVAAGLTPLLLSCTIVDNSVSTPSLFGDDLGGVFGPGRLVSCIVRGNDGLQLDLAGDARAIYSDVEGSYPGAGNFDLDPLFLDAAGGDYRLQSGSPCIDAGSPASPLDPDGSRADVGARRFTHATAIPVNGSGVNLPLLSSDTPPAIGATWSVTVHALLVPSPAFSGVTLRTRALQPGVLTPFGELLITGPRLAQDMRASNGSGDTFGYSLPSDLALVGFEFHAQGFVGGGPPFALHLGNALRVLLGQ